MPARRHPAHKRGTKLRVDYNGKTYAAKVLHWPDVRRGTAGVKVKYAVDETTEVVKWKDVEHRIALAGARRARTRRRPATRQKRKRKVSSDSEWNEESGDASPDETLVEGSSSEPSSGGAPLEEARPDETKAGKAAQKGKGPQRQRLERGFGHRRFWL